MHDAFLMPASVEAFIEQGLNGGCRLAFTDQYRATNLPVMQPGKIKLVFTLA